MFRNPANGALHVINWEWDMMSQTTVAVDWPGELMAQDDEPGIGDHNRP